MLDKLAEHPNIALFFLALGVLSCAKFAFKATGVLLQTFVLPGTGVSYILLCLPLSRSEQHIPLAQEVWRRQGCMGRCVHDFASSTQQSQSYLQS